MHRAASIFILPIHHPYVKAKVLGPSYNGPIQHASRLTQPGEVRRAFTVTSPRSDVSHASSRLPEFIVVRVCFFFSDRIIVLGTHYVSARLRQPCAICCLRSVVYCYGQKPSRARAVIHSAVECISQAVLYGSGEMEWRLSRDAETKVQEESVMDPHNRCFHRKDP